MPRLRPFCPYRYNPALFPDLAPLVAPPYDVIGRQEQSDLYRRHPLNVVRLILNADADPYGSAARLWREWREERYIVREVEPCFVFSVERFRVGADSLERTGIYAAVQLEPFGSGRILPHERTFSAPKEDRLRVLRACRANLSPVFGLYPNHSPLLDKLREWSETRRAEVHLLDASGTEHHLWFLREARLQRWIAEELAEETVIIADGHHRYETALAYCDELVQAGQGSPDAAHRYVMMYLTSLEDRGLVILPTHRVLQSLANVSVLKQQIEEHFELRSYPRARADEFFRDLKQAGGEHCLGMAWGGEETLVLATLREERALQQWTGDLSPAVRNLDVTLLDRVVLTGLAGIVPDDEARAGRLWYTHSNSEALDALQQGAAVVFFMRPPKVEHLLAVCRSGQVMPQKSTYFYPKLLSGLLFQALDEAMPAEPTRRAQTAR